MLVSEEYIVEEIEIDERELERDPPGVHLRYNHTEPSVISDGVDFIAVIAQGDDEYRIDYWGYAFGRMYLTPEGVQELGQRLAYEEDEIPSWTLDPETVDANDPPWWLPDDTAIDPTVACEHCEEIVSVREVVTPRQPPVGMDGTVFCRDCWEQH